MVSKLDRFIFFTILELALIHSLNAQNLSKKVNIKAVKAVSDLKAMELPEYDGNLLSIGNMNLIFKNKNKIPESIFSILFNEKIISNSKDSLTISLLGEYLYSVHFYSYLVLVHIRLNNQIPIIKNQLYLLNVNDDSILSIQEVASYNISEDGSIQDYTINYGNGRLDQFSEDVDYDGVFDDRKDKFLRKGETSVVHYSINHITGQTTIIK